MSGSPFKKVLVVLGAGASNDAYDTNFPLFKEALRPPLTASLLDFSTYIRAHDIWNSYPKLSSIESELLNASQNRNVGIESALRSFANHDNPIIRQIFKYIPAYLRDFLNSLCLHKLPRPHHYVTLCKRLLWDTPQHSVAFVTLNYDSLLETALAQLQSPIEGMADYTNLENNSMLIKFHGSVDWFRTIGKIETPWNDLVGRLDIGTPPTEIVMRRDAEQVFRINVNNQHVYPAITAPLAGKGKDGAVCPPAHHKALGDFLKDCHKMLVIGTSGRDDDLLDALNQMLPGEQTCFFVGKSNTVEVQGRFYDKISGMKRALCRVLDFPFSTFVNSPELAEFLKT